MALRTYAAYRNAAMCRQKKCPQDFKMLSAFAVDRQPLTVDLFTISIFRAVDPTYFTFGSPSRGSSAKR